MKHRTLLFIGFALLVVFVSVVAVQAQVMAPTVSLTSSTGGLIGFVCKMAGWLFTVAIILSIILTIWTGIKYMTASGDPEKFKSAHKMLLYIAIGIAVALVARVMPVLVNSVLQGRTNGSLDACAGHYTTQ